jgi:hypothetical protein
MRDAKMLSEARHEAFALVEGDPELAPIAPMVFLSSYSAILGEKEPILPM